MARLNSAGALLCWQNEKVTGSQANCSTIGTSSRNSTWCIASYYTCSFVPLPNKLLNDDSPSSDAMRSSVDESVGRYVPTTIVRHYTIRTSSRALLLFPSKWHTQGSVVHGLTSSRQAPAGASHACGQVYALWLAGQSVRPVR